MKSVEIQKKNKCRWATSCRRKALLRRKLRQRSRNWHQNLHLSNWSQSRNTKGYCCSAFDISLCAPSRTAAARTCRIRRLRRRRRGAKLHRSLASRYRCPTSSSTWLRLRWQLSSLPSARLPFRLRPAPLDNLPLCSRAWSPAILY